MYVSTDGWCVRDVITYYQKCVWSAMQSTQIYLTLSLHFNRHFPCGPGLVDTAMSPFWILLELRMSEVSGDNWRCKTFKAPAKLSSPTNQHPTFYRPDALPVTQPIVSKHWRETTNIFLTIFCFIFLFDWKSETEHFRWHIGETRKRTTTIFGAISRLTWVRNNETQSPALTSLSSTNPSVVFSIYCRPIHLTFLSSHSSSIPKPLPSISTEAYTEKNISETVIHEWLQITIIVSKSLTRRALNGVYTSARTQQSVLMIMKQTLPLKHCVLVCWCWWFDCSFARLIAPVVTSTFIILSSNKTG